VAPLDDATERLWRAWGLVGLQGVVNTPELREAYNSNLPRVTRFASALGQNLALYRQYQALAASPEARVSTKPSARCWTTRCVTSAWAVPSWRRRRQRFAAIKEELSALSAKFSQNVLDATDAWSLIIEDEARLAGLPEDVKAAARGSGKDGNRAGN
jgi:oligopeptidase A